MSVTLAAKTTGLTRTQVTRAYRRDLGAYEVTALADGFVDLSYAVWLNLSQMEYDAALASRFIPKFRNGITSHLLNTGSKLFLFDSGAAGLFGPNSFHFPANLANAGVRPEDIDEVLVTHAHPDHVGGLLKDGRAALPTARIRMNEIELDFWTSAAEQAKAPAWMQGWWDAVGAVVKAYDGRIETFKAGAALGDGITTIAFPGHTPGQTGYLVESAGDRLLIWGDVAVSTAIQFSHPRASMIFDIDADLGHQSRLRGFDLAARDRLLVAGTHLPFPTFGYVAQRDGTYEWVPEEWRHDLANTPWVPVI
jgi:glyoxylase-like metal-dependent hydrolase (beta-lactamase superfamily II)